MRDTRPPSDLRQWSVSASLGSTSPRGVGIWGGRDWHWLSCQLSSSAWTRFGGSARRGGGRGGRPGLSAPVDNASVVGPVSDRAVGRWRTVAPADVVSTSGCIPGRVRGGGMRREHPHRLRSLASRPDGPSALVLCPRSGQCGTSSWWGKRRCPPSDTVVMPC